MTTPTHNPRNEMPTDEARHENVERPAFKVLVASLILAAIAGFVLSQFFTF